MVIKLPLKEIAKMGNSVYAILAGVLENHKIEIETHEIEHSACPSECPYTSFSEEKRLEVAHVCKEHCPFANLPKMKKKTVYVNEKHRYQINGELLHKRLSFSQICQFTLYHFLNPDKYGVIKYVPLKVIASFLNVTVRTVKNNNKLFEELGMISTSKVAPLLINVQITDYEKYHLTAKEGGSGYTPMPKSFFFEMLKMENVNSLRNAIRNYKQSYEDAHLLKKSESTYSVKQVKRHVPGYLRFYNGIKQVIEGTSSMFDNQLNDYFLTFKLKPEFDAKVVKTQRTKEFETSLQSFVVQKNIKHTEKDMEDLISLAFEYGLTSVLEALDTYKSDIRLQLEEVENIGGKIRMIIQSAYRQKMVA